MRRYRNKVSKGKSRRLFRRTSRPVTRNRMSKNMGIKRGGTRL